MSPAERAAWVRRGEADRADDDEGAAPAEALVPSGDIEGEMIVDLLAYHHDADLADLSASDREEAIAAMAEGYGAAFK